MIRDLINGLINIAQFVIPALLLTWADRPPRAPRRSLSRADREGD
jgi:hypothetical protein